MVPSCGQTAPAPPYYKTGLNYNLHCIWRYFVYSILNFKCDHNKVTEYFVCIYLSVDIRDFYLFTVRCLGIFFLLHVYLKVQKICFQYLVDLFLHFCVYVVILLKSATVLRYLKWPDAIFYKLQNEVKQASFTKHWTSFLFPKVSSIQVHANFRCFAFVYTSTWN